MQYRLDKYGNKISALGFGCMRFTQSGGKIDLDKAEKEIMAAYNAGVNYYDTAYIYNGSEVALGEILARNNIRQKVNIATKLPHYLVKKSDSIEEYFTEQLTRLQTDYVDYYLMHMLTDIATWNRMVDLGIKEWIAEKKASGAIKQIGFSYHGNSDMFIKLIDAYDWDFCQIQYNYMDEHSQAGRTGLQYAASKGIPVVIMEPLRGGKLANIPESADKIMSEHPVQKTAPAWAFSWLWNQPEVTCVLSGMNSLEMVEENVQTASEVEPGSLSDADLEMINRVLLEINKRTKVGCTGCRYCMPCPQGVDIPGSFAAYNRKYSEGYIAAEKEYLMTTALRADATCASKCIGCGKCEKHCPQHIEIRKELKNVRKSLEGPVYHIARWVILKMRMY
ncbi:MAG: aldo/keto reductase [Lachnospiraceae bacterium]|nr:aldo/keto reductase [Lachnospiraceae bacterium]